MKSNKAFKIIFLMVTLLFISGFYSFEAENVLTNQEFKDVTIYAVVNTSKVEVKDPFELLTIIVNPTSFTIKNLSFYILAPPYIEIINATNTSLARAFVKKTVERVNITIKIETIERNSTFIHKLVLISNSSGDVRFDYSEAHFTKVKGEYKLDALVTIPDKTIKVYSKIKAPPEEGHISEPEIIILGLIVLPLVAYILAPRIVSKKEEKKK